MSNGIQARTGQYLHAHGAVRRRKVGRTTYLVGIAGAYDAFGLIGPEHNGVFVLDDTRKRVILDRHAENPAGGYFGPSKAQWSELAKLMTMPAPEFRRFIADHPRAR